MKYCITTRAQILSLLAVDFHNKQVEALTNVPVRTQQRFWAKAINLGFDPRRRPLLILDPTWR